MLLCLQATFVAAGVYACFLFNTIKNADYDINTEFIEDF